MLAGEVPLKNLSVTKTVYLEKGSVVDPLTIVRTHDNGFIIAGSIDRRDQPKSAWATKTDSNGNVVWRYFVPRIDNPAYGQISYGLTPHYSSVAVMPDNSAFLCGGMPGIKVGSGLLTHLDKDGKVLSEKLISPEGLNGGGAYSCAAWRNGVLFLGGTARFERVKPTESHPLPYNQQVFYWIVFLGADGKKKWEKLVPVSEKIIGSPNEVSQLQLTSDGGLVFVATRNGIGSEIIHINTTGEVTASKFFDEPLRLIRPIGDDKNIGVISTTTMNSSAKKLVVMNLDKDLKEISRLTESQKPAAINAAYRLPDNSLRLFGNQYDFRTRAYAVAMELDASIRHMQTLDLSVGGESYWINDAVPLEKPGEFATIRTAIKPNDIGSNPTDEQLDEVRRGVALDFINFQ